MRSLSHVSQPLPRQWLQSGLLHGVLLLSAVLYHLHSQSSSYLSANSLGQTDSSTTTIVSDNRINFLELSFEQYAMTEPQQVDVTPAEVDVKPAVLDVKPAEGDVKPAEVALEAAIDVAVDIAVDIAVEAAIDVARKTSSKMPTDTSTERPKEEPSAAIKELRPAATKPTSIEVLTANATTPADFRESAEQEAAQSRLPVQRVGPARSARTPLQPSSRSTAAMHHLAPQSLQAARPDHAYNPKPAYPLALRDLGVSGVVWLRVWIDDTGRPQEIELSKGSGYRLFDEAALRAVQHWRFIPAKNEQKSLASWVEFAVRFEING